ncbi:MAG: hypothetical protein JW955_10970 [Sedimentisphaerales bacterium]|nr:hypothetical protein [Sedimentisphaerales bacterium]
MAAINTIRRMAILALLLSTASLLHAGEITVINWSGSLDVPDNDEYATSYMVSRAPSGAIVDLGAYERGS